MIPDAILKLPGSNSLTIHKLEEIVEDEIVAALVAGELESLCVVHWSLLLVNLQERHKMLIDRISCIHPSYVAGAKWTYQQLSSH